VRPESILVEPASGDAPAANGAAARVEQVIYRGFVTHYYLRLADGREVIAYRQNRTRDEASALRPGDGVHARWDASANHVITGG
jgi:ABC-type Fe3+/spermidine/putrescine transport system ATPase subunit